MTGTVFGSVRVAGIALCTLASLLLASAPLLAQRADRATIGGVIADEQGAPVPGATVTIKNEGTGVETVLITNEAGAYSSPPLVLGTYSVSVDLVGFKKSVTTGILLQGGDQLRRDVAMQVGAVTETIEVTSANEGLADTRPDVSHTVNEKYYRDLPIVTAADVRLAEAVLQIQPGYLPMKPNGDPMFRGSQFNSRINGGQARATENVFDGAAFGYAVGHQASHESAPPVEAVQEVKVITTTYSAQYGHTSGGFIEYTSKSGTNTLHGSLYEYFAHDALNAKGFFALGKTPLRNDNFGVTLGGPVVIPKVYDGRNRTFFFTNIDWTRFRSGVLPGFGNTTPIDAFKSGDFSALLTGSTRSASTRSGGRSSRARSSIRRRPAGERHPGARSVSGQRDSGRRSAAQPGGRAHHAADGAARSARHLVQRRGQSLGRSDVEPRRAQHHGPRRSRLHAELPDEPQLLLEPPPVDPQLRRGRRLHHAVRRRDRAADERHVLRRRVLSAHLDASRASAVRLGDQAEPAESRDGRLRPLVHGRQLPLRRRRLAAEAVRRESGRHSRHHRRAAGDDVQRQHPLHQHRPELAAASASWSTTAGSSRTTSRG